MHKKPISSDLVGLQFASQELGWTAKDVMLYALGVGARPDTGLDFVYEGKGPKVLPTYAVIPGMSGMGRLLSAVDINLASLLHGEQSIELYRPIPPQGNVIVKSRISQVWDKGKAAVLGIESTAKDADGDLFRTYATLFVRGAGGFGGERGPSTAGLNAVPERAPDFIVEDVTRAEQGAIYRLSGDSNPIHIDPEFASVAGFERPFMHGLCTYGFIGRAVLESLCGNEPARFKSLTGRFADQIYFGDSIITKIWKVGDGEAIIQGEAKDGTVVLNQARATYAS